MHEHVHYSEALIQQQLWSSTRRNDLHINYNINSKGKISSSIKAKQIVNEIRKEEFV